MQHWYSHAQKSINHNGLSWVVLSWTRRNRSKSRPMTRRRRSRVVIELWIRSNLAYQDWKRDLEILGQLRICHMPTSKFLPLSIFDFHALLYGFLSHILHVLSSLGFHFGIDFLFKSPGGKIGSKHCTSGRSTIPWPKKRKGNLPGTRRAVTLGGGKATQSHKLEGTLLVGASSSACWTQNPNLGHRSSCSEAWHFTEVLV